MHGGHEKYEISVGNPKGRHHLEHLSVVGKIIFNLLLSKEYMWLWIGFVWFKRGLSGSPAKRLSTSQKGISFVDLVSACE
jgi:hypothetical protein